MNRIIPRADRGVAIPMRGHHVELADGSRSEQFLGLCVNDRAHPLASDLDDPVGRPSGLDYLRPVGIQMDHGLFAIHVLARLHSLDGCLFVPMVGRADNDGVDILTCQDLSVVTGSKDVIAPEFLAVLEPAVVTVRHSYELHARNLHSYLCVSLALNTSPNQRDLNMIVGSKRRGGFGLECRQG